MFDFHFVCTLFQLLFLWCCSNINWITFFHHFLLQLYCLSVNLPLAHSSFVSCSSVQWKMISMHLKSPYVLHANSQKFLQHCLWNHSTVCLLDDAALSSFKEDHWALPISSFIACVKKCIWTFLCVLQKTHRLCLQHHGPLLPHTTCAGALGFGGWLGHDDKSWSWGQAAAPWSGQGAIRKLQLFVPHLYDAACETHG